MESVKQKINKSFDALRSELGYSNVMQAPRLEKVVISTGVGSLKDKKKLELIEDRLARITGQKPVKNPAKKSIASFKLREGETIGLKVTLRGSRMYDFVDKLINISLPRTKDFRGISLAGVDSMGNYTLGIREHTIFPETSDEDIRDVFGLAITFVTTAKTKKEAEAFLKHIGLPFRK